MGVTVDLYHVTAADLNEFVIAFRAALQDDDRDDFPRPKAVRHYDLHKNWINLLIGLTGEEDPLPGPVTSALFGLRPLFPDHPNVGWSAVFAKDVAALRAALEGTTDADYVARLDERWGAPAPQYEASSRASYLGELHGVREVYASAAARGDPVVVQLG